MGVNFRQPLDEVSQCLAVLFKSIFFRRLFYTWSDDITGGTFHDWIEVSSRDKTCGRIFPVDLYVAPSGDVFVLWTERALDEAISTPFPPPPA